jgi:diaminohydroxyphosphoribosylaminopyrimidine deaminase/5-amino-6-(5-phosphoribosylamino)uracil reductase
MTETEDIKFMHRCLDLAAKAEGMTYPNPLVGSVIVYNGKIVGEGYHLRSGESHAEVIAINSVSDKSLLNRSTLYVNLEPCSHFGKTPPCSDFIIAHNIPRVVIGTADTSRKVSGKGIKKLQDAGCEVITGILDAECRYLNRRFFTFHEKKRPYVTLKWAQSSDGYLDIKRSGNYRTGPTWISGKPERILVHKWRAAEQAILVGAGTVRADNPRLNVREWKGADPLKLILSSSGSFTSSLTNSTIEGKTIVFTHNTEARIPQSTVVIIQENRSSALQICEYLYSSGIQSLFIEGGAEVLSHFISEGLWDETRIFTGKDLFFEGVKAPLVNGIHFSKTVFSGSSLEIYLKNGS